jgi:NAD-dependent SIR2 family protein deacetylase
LRKTFWNENGHRSANLATAFDRVKFHAKDPAAIKTFWNFAKDILTAREKPRPLLHQALSKLNTALRLTAVVSTNVDGFETDERDRDFLPEDKVLRLHGRCYEVQCNGHTVPLTHEMADTLAVQGSFEFPDCPKCAELLERGTGYELLSKQAAARHLTMPDMTFSDDSVNNEIGGEEQAKLNELFFGKLQPRLVFIIGSSLNNALLMQAVQKLENARLYVIDPHPSANQLALEGATIISTTAEKWARRILTYLSEPM